MLKFKRSKPGHRAHIPERAMGYFMGQKDLEDFNQPLPNAFLVKHGANYRAGYFRATKSWREAHPEWKGRFEEDVALNKGGKNALA